MNFFHSALTVCKCICTVPIFASLTSLFLAKATFWGQSVSLCSLPAQHHSPHPPFLSCLISLNITHAQMSLLLNKQKSLLRCNKAKRELTISLHHLRLTVFQNSAQLLNPTPIPTPNPTCAIMSSWIFIYQTLHLTICLNCEQIGLVLYHYCQQLTN